MASLASMTDQHTPTLKQGPSGVRAECSCGWGGLPRYTDQQAYNDHAAHVDEAGEQHVGHYSRIGGTYWCDTCDSPYCELA